MQRNKMVDVTDRMALPRTRLVREGSGMSSSGAGGAGSIKDVKTILCEQESMPGSSSFSAKQVDEIMQMTAKTVGDANTDWSKRINMLKTFRSLCSDPLHHNQIFSYLRHLMPPMQLAVKDLRSQVCREACLTVAYIAQQLGAKSEHFFEPIMANMFSLLVANAKVVSITGFSAILIIYESVHTHRLVPPLQTQMQSKSKEIRRAVCSVLKVIFQCWPASIIQKQNSIVNEIMKKGLTDADPEARMLARECFSDFQRMFPSAASVVVDALDPLQRRALLTSMNQQQAGQSSGATGSLGPKANGTNKTATNTSSLTRQGSIKKTGIPMLSSRASPVKTVNSGRSTSAIDLQAANRARQHHFSTLNNRTTLRNMGRTHSIAASPAVGHNYTTPTHTPSISASNSNTASNSGTSDRSRQRSRISRLSQSQPGSRSNSPSSKFAYATYSSPYSQHQPHSDGITPLSLISPPGRPGRRFSSTSSASSSRDTSPTGRFGSKIRSRSVSQSPQVMTLNSNSSTAKLLLASREAEAALADGFKRDISELDYGNHSDSEDSYTSRTSNRSFMSEFSPTSSRGHTYTDDVEELLTKCGSAKWSERKEGLLGLQSYLNRHGSLPQKYISKIGQTFCRIFMDAHTKVLSLFLDVLHAVLYRHAKDLIDFTSILLNRVLTKLGSDLLTSVQSKLMKTLEILMDEIPADIQFSAVTHYLCDPTQTPNSRSRVAALCHIYNLSAVSIAVKVDELQLLVEKLLDWCGDTRSHELRRVSQKVFYALFDMAAPQMTLVLGQMAPHKQDQAKLILKNHTTSEQAVKSTNHDDRSNISGGWGSIHSEIQSLSINDSSGEVSLMSIMTQLAASPTSQKQNSLPQFLTAIKDTPDDKLIEHHKEILKLIFDTLQVVTKPAEKACCFYCLEELCSRRDLAISLSAFAELIIVRVTDVQTAQMARDVTKAAENCGMALAVNFPPEILVRALCPIVQNKEFPVNQMAIKMLQRMCDSCDVDKLRAFMPDVMNTLIQAYDHPDSAVRKAAVFAMVAIHMRIGAELQPHLSTLSGSKLKLLQLYIQRAQQGSAGGS
ncbi:unnamed protein product [Orchesella dallaii]|uniref:TOG domain-containing protein n=1 Tax=Orchesella dallaii TaxID=48710 RepID=A0ABP1S4N8_9HEXA